MSTTKEIEEQTIRLYIGNISPQLAGNISALEKRLNIFGELHAPIEIKCKETFEGVNNFGYVNIKTDEKRFKKLLSAFHKVKFMNSLLVIEKAKPSFQELRPGTAKENKQDEKIQEKVDKSNVKFAKILNNQQKNILHRSQRYHDYFEIMPGCYRRTSRVKSARKKINLNDISYRVKFKRFNSDTKKYENVSRVCKLINSSKTKLWGYHKDKFKTDLTFKFQNGSWKDGNNHIVETNFKFAENRIDPEEEQSSAKVTKKEINQAKMVLNNLLTNFDFEKPKSFDWNTDRKEKLESNQEKYDYEAHNHAVYFNDDEEDDDKEVVLLDYEKTNKTETLKKLFNNQNENGSSNVHENGNDNGFTFGLADSDIEGEQEEESPISNYQNYKGTDEPIATIPDHKMQDNEPEVTNTEKTKKQLFFPHFESPFLVAQTQFSKLVRFNPENNELIEKWKSLFEEDRVYLMKKFKKRKRDLTRLGNSK